MHGILNCYLRGVRTASVMDVYRCIDFCRCLYTRLYIHTYIYYIHMVNDTGIYEGVGLYSFITVSMGVYVFIDMSGCL